MKKLIILSALVITITGCSLWPTSGEPARKYTLSYTQFTPDVNDLKVRLLIDTPTVYSPLDTLRISLKNSERSIDYFADVEWANRLTNLIHESLIYSFENTGKFPSISRPADGAKVDKILKIEVRGFYMDFFSEPPKKLARVDYSVQIIDKSSRSVTATKAFRAQVYAAEERIESFVQALNQAHLDATTQMINWTMDTLKKAKSDYTTDEKESESDKDDTKKNSGGGSSDNKGSNSKGGGGASGGDASGGGAPKISDLKDSATSKIGELKSSILQSGGGAGGGDDKGGDKGSDSKSSDDKSSDKKDSDDKKSSDKKDGDDKKSSDKKDSGKKSNSKKSSSKKSGNA
jgi:ABC-type uncharacterized transport system auxiliary subunit